VFKYTQAVTAARESSSQFAAAYDRVVAEKHELQERLRVAEAIRDDARLASMRDLEARRSAWFDGVQACIDMVRRRHDHFELYRCDCLDRDPGNGHVPGCKGEAMSTHPATFAILDEIFVFLSALKLRGVP
jgi:hypothetical protein